ncbi:MAG: acyltransferase family protein [Gammaproteobacteria bacterium]
MKVPPARLDYRADIDGLRGIAVLSVIVYHIDERWLPGGFTGVDVFFVVSGYLITRLIQFDIDRGSFSLAGFYRRRIKRIAPAMLLVIGVTLVAAQLLLLPSDAVDVAKSAVASVLGLANVYFWLFQDTGYFAADMRETPLLHLWSLGVEEQFYAIWPLTLVALAPSPPIRWLAVAALLSFVGGELLFSSAPGFVFYMLPTRAGELLVGALLAIAILRGRHKRMAQASAMPLAAFGAALLVGSFVTISNRDTFPGLLALIPTFGTALLILAGAVGPNVISNFLSAPLLKWTGLLSYSAYLWHWPLLAFLRYGYGELTLGVVAAVFVATFALAYLTYRYVETPTRASTAAFRPVLLRQYVTPATLVCAVAGASVVAGGYGLHALSAAYAGELDRLSERLEPAHRFAHVCQRQRLEERDLDDPSCTVGASPSGEPRVLVWGDSNAGHYVGVIEAFAEAGGFAFRNVQVQSCPPIDGDPDPYLYEPDVDNCRESLAIIRARLPAFDVVGLAASWPGYQTGQNNFLAQVFSLANRLAAGGTLVVLLGKAPVPEDFDIRCEAKALRFPAVNCRPPPKPLSADVATVNATLQSFAAETDGVEYFDLTPYLCASGPCMTTAADGAPMYVDAHHISLAAARELGEEIVSTSGLPGVFRRVAVRLTEAQPAPTAFVPRPGDSHQNPLNYGPQVSP